MKFNEYQEKAKSTAIYPHHGNNPFYPGLGLAGEAGEVSGELSKAMRDDNYKITPDRRTKLIKEMGDVLWFMAALATELRVSLDEVAQLNLDKLASRKERGVLTGSGGDR